MIYVFRNFLRNTMLNLSIKSVKHFYPDADIYVICFYKNSKEEYDSQEPLDVDPSKVFYHQTKYKDGKHSGGTNSAIWAEGYNVTYEHFKDYNGKVLMLAEDNFFTTGQTLKELHAEDYVLGYAKYGRSANASMICLEMQEVHEAFPLPEVTVYDIETVILFYLTEKVNKKIYYVSTRDLENYMGDGVFTESVDVARQALQKAGIIK